MPDNAVGGVNRGSTCTDYAKKALKYNSQETYWWLRSPQAYFVGDVGVGYSIMGDCPVVGEHWGIRPGIHIDLSGEIWRKVEAVSVEAYKYKYEYIIDNEKVTLSHMTDSSVWLRIGDEKEEVVDGAYYGIREVGLSRDGAYCTIDREGQAYYGMNSDNEDAIDYLKGLDGFSPWYHRTESGEIVSSCDDAENGEEAARFIYDKDNYVTGYETTKGKIVNWLSFEEMEALCDARWNNSGTSESNSKPNPDSGSPTLITPSGQSSTVQSGTSANKTTVKPQKVTTPSRGSIQSVKNQKGKKILVKWKKVLDADGYQLQYASDKKFKKKVKSKMISAKKKSFTIKGLKKKKTYYVKVRAYTKVNGKKVYGKWSNVKKVKIKK